MLNRTGRSSCLLLVIALSFGADAFAADGSWPSWRGPQFTGVSPEGNPPTTWSETEHVKWKVKLPGHGSGTPILLGNEIFIQAAVPTGKKVEPAADAEKPAAEAAPAETKAPPQVPAEGQGDRPRQDAQGGEGRGRRGGGGGGRGMRSAKPTELHQFVLMSIDKATGSTNWQKIAREELPHEGHHGDHGYSSASPVTDGKHLVAFFGSRGLFCYDMQGNLKWEKDLGDMQTRNAFGEGASPALHDGIVVVNWDHEGEDFIAAFRASTGDELWRQPREEITTWSTPLVVKHGGKAQVIITATNRIRSYDLHTGEQIWECGGMTTNAIPTPVANEKFVFATSGFRGSALLAIQLGRSGDLTDTDAIAWKVSKSTPYVPSPLLYDNRLYFFASNNGILSCHDAETGKALIEPTRVEGLQGVYASPVGAAGRVYLVGRNGTSVVIKHGDTLEILATNVLDEPIDASPAVVGNEMFLRGRESLYCIAE